MNDTFIEGLCYSVQQSMRSYWAKNKGVSIQDITFTHCHSRSSNWEVFHRTCQNLNAAVTSMGSLTQRQIGLSLGAASVCTFGSRTELWDFCVTWNIDSYYEINERLNVHNFNVIHGCLPPLFLSFPFTFEVSAYQWLQCIHFCEEWESFWKQGGKNEEPRKVRILEINLEPGSESWLIDTTVKNQQLPTLHTENSPV